MKKLLFLLLTLTLTGCASLQVSTLNHDPIYSIEGSDAEIVVINNEFELQRLLRTDFNFRFDFAQYALSQPISFDWNNRILGNRYNRYNPYYGFRYSPYWNRTQMWNDWAWGITPHRWSPFFDMIDGDTITTVGITTVGITTMGGTIGTIILIIIEEVEQRILMDVEVLT